MVQNQATQTFIADYTSADEDRIRFDWNGQHAEELIDTNLAFREAVVEVVLDDPKLVPIVLIRDLFRAETQFSREAWGATEGLDVLAEALLRQGGPAYVGDFLEGKYQSFDTNCGSAFDYDLALAETMLRAVRSHLQSVSPDSPEAHLWETGENLFLSWIRDCQARVNLS
jgi:hypothetical protein